MVAGVIGGRYRLDREIGRGGMGAVWLGHDSVLQRAVAVKRVGRVDGLDDDAAYRGTREARLAATLSHPHVVAMLDLVRDDDQVWLVMEHVDSVNLTQLVTREGPLDPDRSAALLSQAAEALAAAHRAGIVHRDVKPSNMLVTPEGRLKLSDFGIARALGDETLTRTGLVVGSPAYLAPEVARGEPASEASDVWSFGATAYFTLTGVHAYETDNAMATLHKIVSQDPPWPPDPGWLAPLFAGSLVVDPERRWSMAEVSTFLHRRPGSTDTRPSATVRRLPTPPPVDEPPAAEPSARGGRGGRVWAWLVAAVVVLALIAGGGWLLAGRDRTPGPAAGSDPRTSSSPSSPTDSPSSSPTGSPSISPPSSAPSTAANGATAAGMASFIQDYLATVTVDPRAGWAMLTPAFREASKPFSRYAAAWQSRPTADASEITADPETLTISYVIVYLDTDGKLTFRDNVTLKLAYADGVYRIAAER